MAPGDTETKGRDFDAKICPNFDGEDPSLFDEYHKRLMWWMWTQSTEDQNSGATTSRIVAGLSKKALRIIFDASPPDEMDQYKKKEGITKLIELLRSKCGKPQSEDLQDLFREFFFRSRIRNDERFSDWLVRFDLVKRKIE